MLIYFSDIKPFIGVWKWSIAFEYLVLWINMFGLKSTQCLALRPQVTPGGPEIIYNTDKL